MPPVPDDESPFLQRDPIATDRALDLLRDGDVEILGSTYASTRANPNARPTNTLRTRMYGQADISFVPN